MVDCPDGNKIIEWQYPGEERKRIIGAASYTKERVPGQCNTAYIVKGRQPRNGLGYCGADWQTNPNILYPFEVRTTGKILGLKRILHSERRRVDTKPDGSCNPYKDAGRIDFHFCYIDYEGIEDPYRSNTGLIYFYDNWRDRFDRGELVYIDSIERRDGLADECGDCVFTIYKEDKVLLEVISEKCPSVDEYCADECPPGTCQCEKKDRICCYDSTGKVVKQIMK